MVQLKNVLTVRLALLLRCLEYVLEEIEHNRTANIMVATHNEDTVKFTLKMYVTGHA